MKRALLTVVVLSLMGSRALGLSAAISGPQFGFPEGTPEAEWKAFLEFLNEDVTFVKGSFINEFTTQSYRGSAEKVSELIVRLHALDAPLKIRFARIEEPQTHFLLSQVGVRETTLTINLDEKDFDWSALVIEVLPRSEPSDLVPFNSGGGLLDVGPPNPEDSRK